MGAIYLYDWYSRYAPSHLYEGTISASKIGIIPILKSIRRTTQYTLCAAPSAQQGPHNAIIFATAAQTAERAARAMEAFMHWSFLTVK